MKTANSTLAIATGVSAAAAFAAWLLSLRWRPALDAYGSELQGYAAFSLAAAPWLLVLPAALVLAWMAVPGLRGPRLPTAVATVGVLLALGVIAGMWLPLFRLSAAM